MKNYFYNIIRKPIVTEKSTELGEKNKYIFEVNVNAEKKDIKTAVEGIFSVKVKAVNTLKIKGKTKRFKGVKGSQSDWKKAIVSLEKDQVIDLTGGNK